MPKILASPLPLFGVLILALALRAWGLTWGLPGATHYFSYHPDESVVLETSSITLNAFAGRLLPHFYNYGSLQLYLVCFANTLAALLGAVDIAPKNFADWYPQWAKMYLVGRCLTVGMGVGTVWAVHGIGRRLWGRRAGLLAALTLAILPLHAQHSHFLTVDAPATFWGTLSLLWAARLATNDAKPLRAALWAGVFAGLAAATKYNMALAVLPVIAACLVAKGPTQKEPTPPLGAAALPVREGKGKSRRLSESPSLIGRGGELVCRAALLRMSRGGFLALALVAFVLAFFAGCPGALLENKTFLESVRFEALHVQNADDPTFRDTGSGFVYHIARNLDAGLGLPLLLLALASVVYALYRRERGDGLLAAFALPYYVLISLAAVRYARYTIPLLPILALWVGRMLADGSRLPRPVWRRTSLGIGVAALGWTLVDAGWLIDAMAEPDSRDEAAAWIKANAPPSASFGYAAMPWFGTVPLNPYFSLPRPGGWQRVTPPAEASRYVYAGKEWDLALLKSANPDYVILSEYDYDDPLRLRDPKAIAYLDYLIDPHHAHAYFWVAGYSYDALGLPKWVGQEPTDKRPWSRVLRTRDLPHDMLYPSPTIYIFSHTPPKAGARE